MSEILFETEGHVTTITLNRPDRLNAISGPMLKGLAAGLLECDQNPDVRAILLTGAGRGFCAGLDLKDVAGGSSDITDGSGSAGIGEMPPMVMRRIDTPLICALNGAASGYGMDLALGCDMLIASDQAKFVAPTRRGVLPESGGTWLLPRLVGWQKACEVVLLSRRLDAAEIERLGLANKVVPHAELMGEARSWAEELASNPPLAVAAAKRAMRSGLDSTFEVNTHHVMAELMQLFRSKDFREGLASFVEKREPRFEGR